MNSLVPVNYTIDVHTHRISDFYRQALIEAGYPVNGTTVLVDGFVTPELTIESYLQNGKELDYDYSIMSVTAPGVTFLDGSPSAKSLARELNEQMYTWTEAYPDTLGAFVCLPLPNIEDFLEEIKYLADAFLDPILEELNRRGNTVLVHPTHPTPELNLPGVSTPAIEYTFDIIRAITNLLFSGSRKKFPKIKIIFSYGGGTLPYLSTRIAGQSSLPFQGGRDFEESMAELRGYYFDLAAATSEPQLAALAAWCGPSQLLTGSDFPYFPAQMIPAAQASLANYSGFTTKDQEAIKHGNALSIFPNIAEKFWKLKN